MAKAHDSEYPEPEPIVREIRQWLQRGAPLEGPVLASSNQGQVIAWPGQAGRWVVKLAHGRGLVRRFRESTLRREYRAYQALAGIAGLPRCAGLVDRRALVLERIQGQPVRGSRITDREAFFQRLLATIQAMHARGVAHGDLKRKSNLLIDEHGQPVIVDLGASLIRKPGRFHPVNQRLFRLLCQTDLNAWVKHKYDGYQDVAAADRQYLKRTPIERWLQALRR